MEESLQGLLYKYKQWLAGSRDDYIEKSRANAEWIRENMLSIEKLRSLNNQEYISIFKQFLSKADGPVSLNFGEPRILATRNEFTENIQFLLESNGSDDAVRAILIGDRSIKFYGRSIWSLIFSAAFPDLLPKVNNKTDKFFQSIGLRTGQEVSDKYLNSRDYFLKWQNLAGGIDFHELDHMMHYGTEIEEGMGYIAENFINPGIAKAVDEYLEQVQSLGYERHANNEQYKFKSQQIFDENFDLDNPDIAEMLDTSLTSSNLLGSGQYFPKKMLIIYARDKPEEVRSALKDLFDEERPIEQRISRYSEFIESINSERNQRIGGEASSYNDARFISCLLSFRYPDRYIYYKYTELAATFRKVYGRKEKVDGSNAEKIMKGLLLGRAILTELKKRPEFSELREVLSPKSNEDNLWFAQDVYLVVGRKNNHYTTDEDTLLISNVKKFIEYSDTSVGRRNDLKMDYKGAKGRAWITVRSHQRMETTWYIFGADNDERGGDWDDSRFGYLYPQHSGMIYLAHNWGGTDRPKLGEMTESMWNNWHVYKEYDPESLPDTLAEDFNLILEEYHTRIGMDNAADIKHEYSLNTIIYGPPGTGKTYSVDSYKRGLIANQQSKFQELIKGSVKDALLFMFSENNNEPLKPFDIWRSDRFQKLQQYNGRTKSNGSAVRNELAYDDVLFERVADGGVKYRATQEGLEYIQATIDTQTDDPVPTIDDFYQFVTFHQSYGYEEFIEGIRAETSEGGGIRYVVRDGVFKAFCRRAESDPDNNYLFVIDEINRANISKVFGELITLLEPNKRIGADEGLISTLPYSGEKFGIPNNVYVLGTMNTADRSIALLDIALRRRFDFVESMPKVELLSTNVEGVDLQRLLTAINTKVADQIDRNHQIGHSYLMRINSLSELHRAWYRRIIPLLREYLYDDIDDLRSILGSFIDQGEVVVKVGDDFRQALVGVYDEAHRDSQGV